VVAASALLVNNRFYSVQEILDASADRLKSLPRDNNLNDFRNRVANALNEELRQLVGRTLLLEEAKRRLTEEQLKLIEDQVQDHIKEVLAEIGGSRKKLEAEFIAKGTTLDAETERYRNQLQMQVYLRGKVGASVTVSRRMLWEYYQAHRDEFAKPKMVQMQIISAPTREFMTPGVTEQARQAARKAIIEAANALNAGEDFDAVARRFSRDARAAESGVWPLMKAGSFRERKVEQAAFELEQEQVQGVIVTETGYWIVKALKVEPAHTPTFEQAQGDIETKIREQQYERFSAEYFEKLWRTATIVESEGFMEQVVNAAIARFFSN
jgi:parvulin-like peptidyl-prolyl isomerase